MKDDSSTLYGYAKINLYLRIFPRAEKGLHPINTIFQSIALSDRILLKPSAGETVFEVHYQPEIPFKAVLHWNHENTIFKVFEEMQRTTKQAIGNWEIYVEKNIPTQSGLGGGSADAAAVLNFFAKRLCLSEAEKQKIAVSTGADVSFQLKSGTAIGEGFGEKLHFLPALKGFPVLLVQPHWTFSTPMMYAKYDEVEDGCSPISEPLDVYWNLKEQIPVRSFNEFERVADCEFSYYRDFRTFFDALNSESILLKQMSGSGSAHFIVFRKDTTQDILQGFKTLCQMQGFWTSLTWLTGEEHGIFD